MRDVKPWHRQWSRETLPLTAALFAMPAQKKKSQTFSASVPPPPPHNMRKCCAGEPFKRQRKNLCTRASMIALPQQNCLGATSNVHTGVWDMEPVFPPARFTPLFYKIESRWYRNRTVAAAACALMCVPNICLNCYPQTPPFLLGVAQRIAARKRGKIVPSAALVASAVKKFVPQMQSKWKTMWR